MAKKNEPTKRQTKKNQFEKNIEQAVDTKISAATAPQSEQISRAQDQSDKFGFDIKHPENWDSMTAESQNKWNEENKHAIIAPAFANKLNELTKTYSPYQENVPDIDRDKLMDLERKKKKRRWMDIGIGALRGMQGLDVDRSKLPTARIAAEQEKMLQSYKDAVTKNRIAKDVWDKQKYDTRLKWLTIAYNKAKTPEERAMYQTELENANREFEAKKAGGYYNRKTSSGSSTPPYKLAEGEFQIKGSNPYTRILQSISPNVERLLPPLPKEESYTPAQKEDAAAQVLLQMYDIKQDSKGNQYLAPIPGKEKYLESVQSDVEAKTKIAPIEKNIDAANLELEQVNQELKNKGSIEWYDKGVLNRKKQELEQIIKDLKSDIEKIKPSKPVKSKTSNNTTSTKNEGATASKISSLWQD